MSNWTPRPFERKAIQTGVPQDYLQPLLVEGQRLRDRGVPVVYTLGHLAAICNVPYRLLRDIVCREFDPTDSSTLKREPAAIGKSLSRSHT